MRIIVFSDSHQSLDALDNAISYYNPDLVYGLGDYGVSEYELMERNVFGVRGNSYLDPDYPLDRIFSLKGFNFLLTHGHTHGVRSDLLNLHLFAKENNLDIIFYGHTHMASITEYENKVYINPGSTTLPYYPLYPTLVYMELEDKIANIKIVDASTFETYKEITVKK